MALSSSFPLRNCYQVLETKLFILVTWKHIAGKVEEMNTVYSLIIKKNNNQDYALQNVFLKSLIFFSSPQTSHTIAMMLFGA